MNDPETARPRRWSVLVVVVALLVVGTALIGLPGSEPGPDDGPIVTEGGPDARIICEDPSVGSGSLAPDQDVDGDVVVEAGASIQDAVDRAGPGAVVVIGEGIHVSQSVIPLPGQRIVGRRGAVLRGEGAPFAFRSMAADVTITGLTIRDYTPESKEGVIHADTGAEGWRVVGNEIHSNAETAVWVRRGARVERNLIHHNGRYGIDGRGQDVTVSDNVIACNGLDYGPSGDSGGTKFVFTDRLRLEGNTVIANVGNGLWVDINNTDASIVSNVVRDNLWSGIFVEISCRASVVDNELSGNGFGSRFEGTVENSAIMVANTPGVTVRGNALVDNAKGIGAIHWNHPNLESVDRCEPELRDLLVVENSITQQEGVGAGLDATIDTGRVWDTWDNRFADNEFDVADSVTFRWEDNSIGVERWVDSVEGR